MIARNGTRYTCPYYGLTGRCDKGDGRAPRKLCRGCRSELLEIPTRYGVFIWRGDGRYRESDALHVTDSAGRAERWADARQDGALVVRYVDAA